MNGVVFFLTKSYFTESVMWESLRYQDVRKIHLPGQRLAPSTPLLYGQCTHLIIPEF